MNKSASVRARMEPELKQEAESILHEFGVTTTQLITMLYKQIVRKHEIPIDMKIPNKETARAIKGAREGKGVVVCKDMDDMFRKLGI